MSNNVPAEMLQAIRFLHDMPPEYLDEIADVAQIRDFDEYDVVFREGEAAENMYLVVVGNVSLEICAPGVGCRQILKLGPGDLLGWSALLEGRYTARARTPQGAQLLQINVPQLRKVCDRDPAFSYELMRRTALALAKRLNATRIQLLNVYGEALPVTALEEEAGDGR